MFDDTDLKSFKNLFSRGPFKRMQTIDKGKTYPDRMPLESVHKVRFNPNLDAHGWVISAGQSGIVRAHCVRCLNTHVSRRLIKEYQAQFNSMFQPAVTSNWEFHVFKHHSHCRNSNVNIIWSYHSCIDMPPLWVFQVTDAVVTKALSSWVPPGHNTWMRHSYAVC